MTSTHKGHIMLIMSTNHIIVHPSLNSHTTAILAEFEYLN